uniref:Uncharacterized protein n=1 Tax=Tetranychus urticae TaxID=32264 RepID=T1JXF5_TETUR
MLSDLNGDTNKMRLQSVLDYKVSAGYSDAVLNGPLPKIEGDFGDEGDGSSGSSKDKKRDFGDGSNGQYSTSSHNTYGGSSNHRDVQEKENRLAHQKRSKLAGGEGQVVFGRKRHGRYEFEDGERYEESGETGNGRERAWYFGKQDKPSKGNDDAEDDGDHYSSSNQDSREHQRHQINDYAHRRRKNYTQLQRSKKAIGNSRVNIGDMSRFRKIHKKHFGGGEEEHESEVKRPEKSRFSQKHQNNGRVKKLKLENDDESYDDQED